MIDCHCHLDLYPNPKEIALQVEARGMSVISVTTTPSAFRGTASLAGSYNGIHTALGLHPQLAFEREGELGLFDELVKSTSFIGEIGLDGAPENQVFYQKQIHVFRHILSTCKHNGGRIMSIHSRRAASHVLDELRVANGCGVPILHWFSGSQRELRSAIDLGVWFSVGRPMLTSVRGRAIVEALPRDKVLTETDGPFVVYNGKPALPWQVSDAVSLLGEVWNIPTIDASNIVQQNFAVLLKLPIHSSAP